MKRSSFLTLISKHLFKRNSSCGGASGKKGLVLGVYDGCSPGEFKFTRAAAEFDKKTSGKLSELLKGTGVPLGEAALFTNLDANYYGVAVGGLGPEGSGYDHMEKLNVCKENIRIATGHAVRKLHDNGVSQIFVEEFTTVEPAGEAAGLGIWEFQDLKSEDKRKPIPKIEPYTESTKEGWEKGLCKAEGQNLARYVEEVPANLMTPTRFAETAVEALCGCGVQVDVHDKDWIETRKMGALLSISEASCETPLFLELKYCGGQPKDQPVILIGKGITYDTGGLSLKDKYAMSEYRGDLAGGAVILGTMRCIARMALPMNVIGLVPLCENMIGGLATRPGDVVLASNGKTVRIDHPDNEGRVMLADAITYAFTLKPCLVMTIATMTPGMRKTLGSCASGAFTNSHDLWMQMELAGAETGDRFWRFPSFWDVYRKQITGSPSVDITNYALAPGNSCQAALFLEEFLPYPVDFAHMDITGTGLLSSGVGHPYLKKGVMTGRPTRTVAQILYQLACPHSPGDDC